MRRLTNLELKILYYYIEYSNFLLSSIFNKICIDLTKIRANSDSAYYAGTFREQFSIIILENQVLI